MDDDTGGVLTVLQQGSPPRQRLARSRDALALKASTKSPQTSSLALGSLLCLPISRGSLTNSGGCRGSR